MEMNKISYVIPCYRSEQTLAGVVAEIDEAMAEYCQKEKPASYEIIMVNDGSPDDTWGAIRRLCEGESPDDPGTAVTGKQEAPARGRRIGISFARNFGQHAALMAGIRRADGDVIVCLDDDGQTPANEVSKLLAAIEAGADVVYASYGGRKQHSGLRNLGTAMNEKMTEVLLGKPKELFVSSYFAMRRFVAEEVRRYDNSYPYLIGLVLRSTKNIVNVEVTHRRRERGQSGYTFSKLLGLWMNGFTAFSVKPLRIATAIGGASAIAGFLYGIYTIIKRLVRPDIPMGFSALMSAVVFFGGMILLLLGLAGEYIGRTYISTSNAPQYVIRETVDESASADKSI